MSIVKKNLTKSENPSAVMRGDFVTRGFFGLRILLFADFFSTRIGRMRRIFADFI